MIHHLGASLKEQHTAGLIRLNKTQVIRFRLLVADSVVYLVNTLQFNLSDKLDIHLKSMSFICKSNTVYFHFKCMIL